MRIVIDMQGAQTESRLRGIGRYTLGLVKGIVRNRAEHEIILLLNGMLPEAIDSLRATFTESLPPENIRVWYAPVPLSYMTPNSECNRAIASAIYASLLDNLNPDVLLITSMMEGWGDDFCCNLNPLREKTLRAGILYDFLPFSSPVKYLSPLQSPWYQEHFQQLKLLHLGLTISDFTRSEAGKYLPDVPTVSISSACDDRFTSQVGEYPPQDIIKKIHLVEQFILYVGGLEERKNVPFLLAAFNRLPAAIRAKYKLVFPCGGQTLMLEAMRSEARRQGLSDESVYLLGRICDEDLCALYKACSLFVFPSLEEGFGLPVLEAMCCGAPVIGSNTTAIPEVIGLEEALFDPHDVKAFAAKIEQALTDEAFRTRLIKNSKNRAQLFSWDISAQEALHALEENIAVFRKPAWTFLTPKERISNVCTNVNRYISAAMKVPVAECIARTFDREPPQLLIDIGNLAQSDARTGIQRVTRSIVSQIVANPPHGYIVRPVYATFEKSSYVYAHTFSQTVLGYDDGLSEDCAIDWSHRDIFLGLDLQLDVVPTQMPVLNRMKRHGVSIHFVVYDLLAIQFPQYCSEGIKIYFPHWLKVIGEFDGLISISQAVMNDVQNWMKKNGPRRLRPMKYSWFHLGSDIDNSIPTTGLPKDADFVIGNMSVVPAILMVSTIEPRKGHRQALSAFELLWKKGVEVNLVIVGKLGWKMDDFVVKLDQHPQRNKHLFWLQGISDEYLEKIYEASTAVLMASEGEGFGLAVVEGARHGKPLILRDIPVFREIAEDHAFYFDGFEPESLAISIEMWLQSYTTGTAPSSEGIKCLTWGESAKMLLQALPLKQ